MCVCVFNLLFFLGCNTYMFGFVYVTFLAVVDLIGEQASMSMRLTRYSC